MRKLPVIVCLAVAAAVLFVSPVNADRARKGSLSTKCPPVHAHILLANSQAAIYTIRESQVETIGGHHYRQPITATRSCDYAHRGSYLLNIELFPAPTEVSAGISNPTLDGAMLAYEESASGVNRYKQEIGKSVWRVVVRNLRTGQVLHDVPTRAANPPNPHFIGDGPTTMIVVKGNGAVAWIVDHVEETERYQVHAVDKGGSRVLATGSDIDPHSLALTGHILYWTQGGQPHSATLN